MLTFSGGFEYVHRARFEDAQRCARDFYRDIKEEKVKKRIVTIAIGRWLQFSFRKHEGFQSIQDSNEERSEFVGIRKDAELKGELGS